MTDTAPYRDTAAATAAVQARIDARIEDLVFLLEHHVPVEFALERVDWKAAAASKALRRRGLTGLARMVDHVSRAQYSGPTS